MTILLVAGVLALAAAGCGGSSNSSTSTTTATETTTETETTTSESTETETSTDTETTTGALGSFGSGDCLKLAETASKFGEALSSSASGSEGLQKAADAYKQLADAAPDAIRTDMQTVAAAFAKYIDAIKGIDLTSGQTPSADDLAKLQQAAAAIDTKEVTDASQRISTWTNENCTTG